MKIKVIGFAVLLALAGCSSTTQIEKPTAENQSVNSPIYVVSAFEEEEKYWQEASDAYLTALKSVHNSGLNVFFNISKTCIRDTFDYTIYVKSEEQVKKFVEQELDRLGILFRPQIISDEAYLKVSVRCRQAQSYDGITSRFVYDVDVRFSRLEPFPQITFTKNYGKLYLGSPKSGNLLDNIVSATKKALEDYLVANKI